MKNTLGFEFPNLPYLIDGDVRITQSMAILRYIARKAGLLGVPDNASAAEHAQLDMLQNQIDDLRYVPRLAFVPLILPRFSSTISVFVQKVFSHSRVSRKRV